MAAAMERIGEEVETGTATATPPVAGDQEDTRHAAGSVPASPVAPPI